MIFGLPDFALITEFPFCAKGKPTLHVLHGSFERDVFRWGKDDVKVVRHNHESVQHEFLLLPVRLQDVEE